MRIKKMLSQHRRDFHAIYICDYCDHERTDSGYDDRNFHDNVIPNMECPRCKKKGTPIKHPPTPTKYAPHEVI